MVLSGCMIELQYTYGEGSRASSTALGARPAACRAGPNFVRHSGEPPIVGLRISKCHTKLLETTVTRTKQTTEVVSKCHKIEVCARAFLADVQPHRAFSNRDTKTIRNGRNSNKINEGGHS